MHIDIDIHCKFHLLMKGSNNLLCSLVDLRDEQVMLVLSQKLPIQKLHSHLRAELSLGNTFKIILSPTFLPRRFCHAHITPTQVTELIKIFHKCKRVKTIT